MNTKSAIEIIKRLPPDISILIIGPHGIGKSAIVKQAALAVTGAKSLDDCCYDIRLSQKEVGDITGLPHLNEVTKTTEFFKPAWWPRNHLWNGFLFFDELNRGSKEVTQSVFQIVLDRSLDMEKLPPNCRVISAINGDENYQVGEIDPALFDRFFVIDLRPTVEEWLDWAGENGIHRSITQFIRTNGDLLFAPKDLQVGIVYPSPRSWDRFNQSMNYMDLWKLRTEEDIIHLASGFLGASVASKFCEFFLRNFKLISPKDALDDFKAIEKDFRVIMSDPAASIAFGQSFIAYMKDVKMLTDIQAENCGLVLEGLHKEVAGSIWKDFASSKSFKLLVTKKPEFKERSLKVIRELFIPKNESKEK